MNEGAFLFLNRPWCVAEFQRVNVVGSDGTSCDNKNVLIPGRNIQSVSMNIKFICKIDILIVESI